MKDLVLIGASGYGREVYDTIERINKNKPTYNVVGFIDDDEKIWETKVNGIEVLGGIDYIKNNFKDKEIYATITIASADVKKKISSKLEKYVTWENIVDPTALISNYCHIGKGTLIGPYSQVGPNSKVGDFCSVLFGCSIGHDAVLEDFVSVMDYCDITGYDYLEEGVYLGSSVAILPNIRICKDSVVGGGAVVVKNLLETGTYIGIPAKKM